MLIMDEAGRILFANKQIEALFGYDRGDLLGQSLTVLVPSGQPELLTPEPAGWRVGSADLHGVRKDGSEIPIELDVSSLQTAQGHFGLGAVTDISDASASKRNYATSFASAMCCCRKSIIA